MRLLFIFLTLVVAASCATSAMAFSAPIEIDYNRYVCDNPVPLPSLPSQTMCSINGLTAPAADWFTGPGWYEFNYTIFGYATRSHHDGINAWVGGSPEKDKIAPSAIRPSTIGPFPGDAGAIGVQKVYLTQPFDAQVQFATWEKGYRDPGKIVLFGGHMAKDRAVASFLQIQRLDPSAGSVGP
jgi:hypothetical protein